MRYLITGCAGFIGSNLTDRLLMSDHTVIGIDNFSTGQRRFIGEALKSPRFKLIEADLLSSPNLRSYFEEIDIVVHLAANADVRYGTVHTRRDLEQNTLVTHNVLEAMRVSGVTRIAFSSTGSVYGCSNVIPTPEDAPFPLQTSLYGASKVACEGLIAAYCEGFGFQSWIFRFVSILGERYSHGHVFDFYRQLKNDPKRLHVLGDGTQRKSYLYVHDCIDAMLSAMELSNNKVNIFNLGVADFCNVHDSVAWISNHLGVDPRLTYSGGNIGWIGDNPFIFLDTSRINSLGWIPKVSIKEGIIRTLEYLRENDWLFESRK